MHSLLAHHFPLPRAGADFQENNFHILGLVETWLENDNKCIDLPGFDFIVAKTRKKDKKARRNSGGVSIYAKSFISKGITKLKTNHSDVCWIKLERHFFGLQRDIYLAIIYLSPESASCSANNIEMFYSNLLEGIVEYSKTGDIIINNSR